MVTRVLQELFAITIGIAGGIAVGSGMVAFLVVLNIIPRLAQLTISREYLQSYEAAVITGALSFTWIDMFNIHLQLGWLGILIIGIFSGSFVGMLAAALTEVINVIPILAKRLGLDAYVLWLLMAMILGKVAGSLFEWFLM